MTLKQLEYFLAIAETGNMTQAAKNLNISQPPLSLQLKALEDEFGVLLFHRTQKKLILTPKGKILMERCQEILRLVNNMVSDLQSDQAPQVTIRLGTITSVCSRLLPSRILEFKERYLHLHVDFQIYEGSTPYILEQLDNHSIDVGLIREPFNTTLYHYAPIKDEVLPNQAFDYFVAIAKPDLFPHPSEDSIPLVQLKGKPLIVHRRYLEMLTNVCRQNGFAPTVVCQNNDVISSISWASAGIGIALVPYSSAMMSTRSPDLAIKTVVEPKISSRAYMVWRSEGKLSQEITNFIQMISG